MSESKPTLGTAIDQIVQALNPFDERERETILGTVCSYLSIRVGSGGAPQQVRSAGTPGADIPVASSRTPGFEPIAADIRSLKTQKQPNSARQMACLVAYYLQDLAPEEERKNSITTADLEKYFKQANYKLPTKLEQVLVDSKKSGYFDSAARGEYKLTRVGYNLVTHSMPSKSE